MANAKTLQTGIKKYDSSAILNYSLFLGGLNATHQSLQQYDPLKTGYNRIFFVKMPVFMEAIMPEETKRIRHIMEYGFTEISGINGTTLNFEQMTGGYSGKQLDVPTHATDDTNELTLTTYEFAGSPVREYMDMWISGISDQFTGLGTYHGALDAPHNLKYAQYNHVAEAIYVATDATGRPDGIEYACLLTNMIPKQVKKDQFNYSTGTHNIVTVDTAFSCVKYESPQINDIAKALMKKYQTMADYLEFSSEYTANITNPGQSGTSVGDKAKYPMRNWNIGGDAVNKPYNQYFTET